MTTSNKNFKVKNGLEVLGTSATVNGNSILTAVSGIESLANVDITGLSNGDVLIYDSSLETWLPGTVGGGGGGTSVTVSDTAPLNPEADSLWYNSASGALLIFYTDANSSQWVQIGVVGAPGESGIVVSDTAPEDTSVLWLDTTETAAGGLAPGGTAGQVLSKIDSQNYNTEWLTPYNSSNAALDIASAVSVKANIANPTFTGTVVAPALTVNGTLIASGISSGPITTTGNINPQATNSYDLGTSSLRWRNIYTQDLNLSNGIGDYTVIEGEENLYLVNNKSNKSFKFALIEVDPSEVPAKSES